MRLWWLTGLVLVAGVGQAARITVAPAAAVRGTEVLLCDVAAIDGTVEEQQQLQKVNLGAAPPLGQRYTFTAGMIRMRLRQYGIDNKTHSIDCPSPVVVTRAGNRLTGQAIVEETRRWLQDNTPLGEHAAALIPTRQPDDIELPAGTLSWQCVELATSTPQRRDLQVTALVDGASSWRGLVTLAMQQITSVLVVRTAIVQGQPITADMLASEPRDLARTAGVPIRNLQELMGMRAIHPLPPGKILLESDIQAVPLVKRGDLVSVRAQCGALVISARAIAGSDGGYGAVIRVKNVDTREDYSARVTGPGTLEMP